MAAERWNLLNPTEEPRVPMVTSLLSKIDGPKIAVTDFMRIVPDQVGRWVPGDYVILGTDGFGRSDTRIELRRFFETDAAHVTYAVLSALARRGRVDAGTVTSAAERFEIATDSSPPWTR